MQGGYTYMGEQNRIRQSETESLYLLCMLSIQFFHIHFKHKYFIFYTLCIRIQKITESLCELCQVSVIHQEYRFYNYLSFDRYNMNSSPLFIGSLMAYAQSIQIICYYMKQSFLFLMQRNSCSRPNILVEKKYFVFSLLYTCIPIYLILVK